MLVLGMDPMGFTAPPPPEPSASVADDRMSAGLGLLLAGAGAGIGCWLGGLWGAGAGLLLVGASRNGLRAGRDWQSPDPQARAEAGRSAGIATIGGVAGGYLAYRAYHHRLGE